MNMNIAELMVTAMHLGDDLVADFDAFAGVDVLMGMYRQAGGGA